MKKFEVNDIKTKQNIKSYKEGLRMRIEDLESQLIESIMKNNKLAMIYKECQLTIEGLSDQLLQYKKLNEESKNIIGKFKNNYKEDKIKECKRSVELLITKIDNENKYKANNELIITQMKGEINTLSEELKQNLNKYKSSQSELAKIKENLKEVNDEIKKLKESNITLERDKVKITKDFQNATESNIKLSIELNKAKNEQIKANETKFYSEKLKLEAELKEQKETNEKLKFECSRILAEHSEAEVRQNNSKQLQELNMERIELIEKLNNAENIVKSLENQITNLNNSNMKLQQMVEMNEKRYLEDKENNKNEINQLCAENRELTLNLEKTTDEYETLKTKFEISIHKSEYNECSYFDELDWLRIEELREIKAKAIRMPNNNRLEYYELLIESLIIKRHKIKKNCEKRIADFENVLRLIQFAIQSLSKKE